MIMTSLSKIVSFLHTTMRLDSVLNKNPLQSYFFSQFFVNEKLQPSIYINYKLFLFNKTFVKA